jgi:hypothetical protein
LQNRDELPVYGRRASPLNMIAGPPCMLFVQQSQFPRVADLIGAPSQSDFWAINNQKKQFVASR